MSTITSNSTLSEVPGVTTAVEKLQELGARMKHDEFGFSETDVINIDVVIEAIKELEEECSHLHEKLETETIQASVLRHKLHFFPGQIQAEIQAAIDSARQSNADELNALQQRLKSITDNIEYLDKRHKELEDENAQLHPERDRIREEHEEIIAQLNQRMAEKASKQIALNETRDCLRETNQKIVDLEDGIIQLKEDLIQERADARMEKKRLKKAVYNTTMKTREQREANVVKKKELDEIHEKVMDSESKLDDVRKEIRRFEGSKNRLEVQESTLSAQLMKEIQQNEDLRVAGEKLTCELAEEKQQFEDLTSDLQRQIKELDEDIERQTKKNKELSMEKIDLQLDLQDKTKIRRSDELKVKEAKNILQEAKEELAFKAEEVARLTQENMDMEENIVEIGETHNAIVATLQKQIDEYREQLNKERSDRMELQDQRDDVQKEIDDFQMESRRYVNEMNRAINEGKKKHDELTSEGTRLQKTIREQDENLGSLHSRLQKESAEFERQHTDMDREISTMKKEMAEIEKEIGVKKALVDERMPGFQEHEAMFEEKTTGYDKMKKDIVAMKNKKMGLEDNVKRQQRELDKMVKPYEELQKELKKKREASLKQMKQQAEDVQDVERSMYTVGCKLETATEENCKFEKENEKLQKEIESLKQQMNDNEILINDLSVDFYNMRVGLEENWDGDHKMEQEYAVKDQVLVEQLKQLLSKTERREGVIAGITDKLQSELQCLAQFLDNVARRRPKSTRQGLRPGRSPRGEDKVPELTDLDGNPMPRTIAPAPPSTRKEKTTVIRAPRVRASTDDKK